MKTKYLGRHFWLIAMVLFFGMLENLCAAFYPLALGYLIDDYSSIGNSKLWLIGALFFASCACLLVFDYLTKRLMIRLSYAIKCEIRKDLFATILTENSSSFHEHPDEYYASLLTSDVDALYDKYYQNIVWFFIRVVDFTVFFALLAYINWIMFLVIFSITFISFFIPKLVGKKLEANEKDVSESNASYLSDISELIKGREFANERTLSRFEKIHEKSNLIKENSRYKANRYVAFVDIFQGVSLYIIQAVTFCVGLVLLRFSLLSLGGLTASLLFADLLVYPTNDAIGILFLLKGGKAYERKIEENLSHSQALVLYSQTKIETLKVDNLSAKAGDFILSGISFDLSFGKKMAVVGKNGAGKSTLLKTLLGIEKSSGGALFVNGRKISPFELAAESAYINQDIFLFEATVEENITLFGSYPLSAVFPSLQKINLGKNLDCQVGRNGSCLSGGEKAKVAILRALCRGQSLLIFDEAFAAIDEKSASEIQSFLKSKDIMLISVTHDLSSKNLLSFDKILIVKDGKEVAILPSKKASEAAGLI